MGNPEMAFSEPWIALRLGPGRKLADARPHRLTIAVSDEFGV